MNLKPGRYSVFIVESVFTSLLPNDAFHTREIQNLLIVLSESIVLELLKFLQQLSNSTELNFTLKERVAFPVMILNTLDKRPRSSPKEVSSICSRINNLCLEDLIMRLKF